jgi:superfamily I DNA/RNA helicase
LKVNYRTSHQIRSRTETLLPRRLVEADGEEEDRGGVISTFHGPDPAIHAFPGEEAERDAAVNWVQDRLDEGIDANRVAILVRSEAETPRGRAVLARTTERIRLLMMHEAKGREFQAVLLLACDSDIVPSEGRLLDATDEREISQIFETERHLLYVAATRARDHLWISGVEPVSEFLADLFEQ